MENYLFVRESESTDNNLILVRYEGFGDPRGMQDFSINLAVTQRIKKVLERRGYEVFSVNCDDPNQSYVDINESHLEENLDNK